MADTEEKRPWRDYVIFAVALLALLGFGWLVKYMLGRTASATDLEWTRAIYLLSGVEAIAFAAAGFLFGREVHRREAETAEQRAHEAEARIIHAQAEVAEVSAKGIALAAAIDAKAQKDQARFSAEETVGIQETARFMQADLDELRLLARKLFPEKS